MHKRPEYLEEESTFVEEIEEDANICNNCYRRVRQFKEPAEQMPDSVSSIVEYEKHASFGYFDDYDFSGRPSEKKSYCKCGAVDWDDARIRPISSEEMSNIARRLSERLSEKDIEHKKEVLISVVEEKKDKPEYQFREEKVFEEAVEEAIV